MKFSLVQGEHQFHVACYRAGFIPLWVWKSWMFQTQGGPREGLVQTTYANVCAIQHIHIHNMEGFTISILMYSEIPSRLQSEALTGFGAALSGGPAKTSDIPQSSISVETHL